ncbi:uncharacterized MFS-type transporter C09D4.1-like [Anthonomus grandis grandis]|uniref:uncharacterized MFS-type transporter C09D4.1-like n=1 Tax=Anthonomus grandis grandis TaxID=2921223 RepID=UPI0021652246|nr:uncharacterized MFS-type transporter C09D4.1-like [Anthonomus grandis grandis]
MMQNSPSLPENLEIRVYKKRWYILNIFFYYSCINAIQMTEYVSITDIVAKYYNVSTFAVEWTSLCYMVLYPVMVGPASYIIEKKGLRTATLIGCVGTAIGTTIKLFSIDPGKFWVVMLGQITNAFCLAFIMSLPPKIAAQWFKSSEVSLACALGSLGPTMGNAIGYLLTVSIVRDSGDLYLVGKSLSYLCWCLTVLMIPVTLFSVFYYPEKPDFHPSIAQYKKFVEHRKTTGSRLAVFKSLIFTKGFFIHLLVYAINIGVLSTIMILISEFVNVYFENSAEHGGNMGFCLLIFGILGSVIFGYILDKTHKYKEVSVVICLASAALVMLLLVAFERGLLVFSYIICSIFGIFINSFIPVGYEFGIELTYPQEESTVAGVLFGASQIASVIFGVSVTYINMNFGPFYALISLVILLLIGSLLEICVPNRLERQEVFKIERTEVM